MSRKFLLLPKARKEFDDSIDFYELSQSGLGTRFDASVRSMIDQITEHPKRFPLASRTTRVAGMTRFPFNIYCREKPDHILIVAIYHHRRHPDGWKGRR